MREILQRMIKVDGRVSTFVTSELYQLLLARSLDAHGSHVGDLALRLSVAGHVGHGSAGSAGAFSPLTGSPYHSALVIPDADSLYVIGVEWRGKPNPKLDAIIARALGRPSPRESPKGPDYNAISTLRVFRVPQGELGRILEGLVRDTWSASMLISMTPSYANLNDNTWTDGVARLNVAGVDHWRGLCGALRRVLTADAAERVLADAAAYDARLFNNFPDPELDDYAAAREYAAEVARVDGYLPAAAATALVANLETFKAENDLSYLLSRGYLFQVYEACVASGHGDEEAEFDFSDLNSGAYATGEAGVISIFLRDQNRQMRIDLQRDGDIIQSVSVFSRPRDGDRDLQLLAAFSVSLEGGPLLTRGTLIAGDDIRAWNSFVVCTESAALSLEEEYADGAPGP
jgi:hypothetical protein